MQHIPVICIHRLHPESFYFMAHTYTYCNWWKIHSICMHQCTFHAHKEKTIMYILDLYFWCTRWYLYKWHVCFPCFYCYGIPIYFTVILYIVLFAKLSSNYELTLDQYSYLFFHIFTDNGKDKFSNTKLHIVLYFLSLYDIATQKVVISVLSLLNKLSSLVW